MAKADIIELITRRHRQLLVHSFLYYCMDATLVPDHTFDEWRIELSELHTKYPRFAKECQYYDICKGFKNSPSGFFIKEYPVEIVTTATHLLYHNTDARDRVHFDDFVRSYGLTLLP